MPIPLRADFEAQHLRALARKSRDAAQARRLLALAAVYDGATRTEAARIGGVTLQIVRDWVLRFNAGGADGLLDRKAPGQPSKLDDTHRAALAAVIDSGPVPAIHGAVRWRIIDLCQWLWEEFRISIAKQTLSRELRAMGYRKLSARPRHHAQAEGAIEHFKKACPPVWMRLRARRASRPATSRSGSAIRPARVGQKNKITRRWAKRGTRPVAPRDQRTASTYIFGAICPKEGKAAGLVLPRCDTDRGHGPAPGRHLGRSRTGAACGAAGRPGRVAHLGQARRAGPDNITLVPWPAKCPELNSQENVWQFMRDNWLSNRIFSSYEDLLDHCCGAWNKLVEQPWRIMSLGLRDWAHGF